MRCSGSDKRVKVNEGVDPLLEKVHVPRLMHVWFLVLIWLFTGKEKSVSKDLQEISVVIQVMITLLNPNPNKTQKYSVLQNSLFQHHQAGVATNEYCQIWTLAEFTACRTTR